MRIMTVMMPLPLLLMLKMTSNRNIEIVKWLQHPSSCEFANERQSVSQSASQPREAKQAK